MVLPIVFVVSAALLVALAAMPRLAKRDGRALPDEVADEISAMPERRRGQHVVDLQLSDGRLVENVWIAWARYPALIGGRTITGRYRPSDVLHARQHSA